MGTYIAASLRTHVYTRAGGYCEYCHTISVNLSIGTYFTVIYSMCYFSV